MVLKLEADVDRHSSEHGRKDAKDVIRILLLASQMNFDPERAVVYINSKRFDRLERIAQGPEFTSLAHGNVKLAKQLRQSCNQVFQAIQRAYDGADTNLSDGSSDSLADHG